MSVYLACRASRTSLVIRGLVAVARLFLSALDALVTAAVGIPPIAWCSRQFAGLIREAYRIGRYGEPSECTDLEVVVVDAEVIDDEEPSR